MSHILDFCGECGVLLPPKEKLNEPNSCDNCGADITERNQRIQGEFGEVDALRLIKIAGYYHE